MSANRGLVIVVLSCHPLLGEGVGRLLGAEPGVSVHLAACEQAGRIDRLLAESRTSSWWSAARRSMHRSHPRSLPRRAGLRFTIGSGPTWVYRRQEIPGDPVAILELVRLLRSGHPVIPLGPRRPRGAPVSARP